MMRSDVISSIEYSIEYIYLNDLNRPVFPIEPIFAILKMSDCRCISYKKLADIGNTDVSKIIKACNSSDGATFYDPSNCRYLIAYNGSIRSEARIRWTLSHEIGHIVAGHFIELADTGAIPSDICYMEDEANYFAANFLAPIPAIRALKAHSADDIRVWFGLSRAAAQNRWDEYIKSDKEAPLERYFNRNFSRSVTKRDKALFKGHNF